MEQINNQMILQMLSLGARFSLILLALAGLSFPPVSAWAGDAEQRFASPEAAVAALVAAAQAKDTNALHSIFGPEGRDLVSPDVVQAGNSFSNFVRRLTRKTDLIHNSQSNILLQIGADAWPEQWGNSGVMTFIVNQEGKVFQKNLGAKTAALAAAMTAYDPDPTWKPASPDAPSN
jgi:hypothetical protein